MTTQWVQHISGQGEKYEVMPDPPSLYGTGFSNNPNSEWIVRKYKDKRDRSYLCLPLHEYKLCDPPTRWIDVTEWCRADHGSIYTGLTNVHLAQWQGKGVYRLRKVQLADPEELRDYTKSTPLYWAFIVEKLDGQE